MPSASPRCATPAPPRELAVHNGAFSGRSRVVILTVGFPLFCSSWRGVVAHVREPNQAASLTWQERVRSLTTDTETRREAVDLDAISLTLLALRSHLERPDVSEAAIRCLEAVLKGRGTLVGGRRRAP